MKIFSYIWKVEERSCGISYYVIVKNGITYEENGNEEKWKKRGWAQRKANTLNDKEYPYKTLKKLGIEVKYDEIHNMDYIDVDELDEFLYNKGHEYTEKFCKSFGCQTVSIHGPYPWDVEAVLCKLETGKLTGSQKHWD